MIVRKYNFRFYLHARHQMHINGSLTNIHPHTWELQLSIIKKEKDFIQFSETEEIITNYLSKFENKFLNELTYFKNITPSTENLGEILFKELNKLLINKNWVLISLKISENPSRTYSIELDEIHALNNVESIYESSTDFMNDDEQIENNIQKTKKENEACEEEILDTLQEDITLDNNEKKQELEKNKVEDSTCDFVVKGKSILLEKRISKLGLLGYLIISIVIFILFLLWLTRKGMYPWGSDTWGHLFKGELLYNSILSGDIFLNYTKTWYNGMQPFRYWAPIPYYILSMCQFVSQGNIIITYYVFLFFVYIMGIIAWYLIGKSVGRKRFGIIMGQFWFFNPDNLRVLFAEGNFPRVVVAVFFPFLILAVYKYFQFEKKRDICFIAFWMFLITMTHAMISAMTGITLFIWAVIYYITTKRMKKIILMLTSAALGIGLSSIWLYPALKGGIMSLQKSESSIGIIVNRLTSKVTRSLNPFARYQDIKIGYNPDTFYFGLFIFIIMILGLFYSNKKIRGYFLVAFIIFLGSTRSLVFLFINLPLSELFWMTRYTPFAMAFIAMGLLLWYSLKKNIRIIFIFLLAIEGIYTVYLVCFSLFEPRAFEEINKAVQISQSRIGVLDLSRLDADPSYFISRLNQEKELGQVFGWAWQGAATAQNIMLLNTGLEFGFYDYMFDRSLEMGADTLIAFRPVIKDEEEFLKIAKKMGYKVEYTTEDTYVLKYPINKSFGTIPEYQGIVIGEFAGNIVPLFPSLRLGNSQYIDEYTLQDLENYKTIVLTGFKYHDKKQAEEFIKNLASKGKRIVIDLTDNVSDDLTKQTEFLNVFAQPVKLHNSFPQITMNNKDITFSETIQSEENLWRTSYLINLDNKLATSKIGTQEMTVIGTKENKNIYFVGFNLFYHSFITKDKTAIDLLEECFNINAYETPTRKIIPYEYKFKDNTIYINGEKGMILDLAYLDAFKSNSIEAFHNMTKITKDNLKIKVGYPYLLKGLIISLTSFVLLIILLVLVKKVNKNEEEYII